MDCKAPLGFKKILSDGSHQEVFVPQNRKYISAHLFCDIMIVDFDGYGRRNGGKDGYGAVS